MTYKDFNKEPRLSRIPRTDLHHILHYLMMQQASPKDASMPRPYFPNGRHRYFLFGYYKSFRVVNRLKGTALSLVKRQFIKKPKNPI